MAVKCPKVQGENPDDTFYCGKCAAPLKHSADISVTKTLETLVEQLIAGSTFANRYKIIEELGKGGMGRVYKVHDAEINESVALKLLKPEIASDEQTIERFRNELKIARRISHKNVCRMYDIGREDDKYFITMEYVAGDDLRSLLRKRGKLSTKEAVGIAQQVCEGLVEAHRLGVVHRDLKPQNIMIDDGGQAKIMDFGIARSVEAPGVTQTGVIIGTPDYISPEQAEGEKTDQRSDIYSLGVMLYEMVTGSVPFKGDTAFSVALKHQTQLPQDPRKLNSQISDDLSRLVLVCMEKNRERRYQTAADLLADLRNIEEGFPLGTKIKPRRKTFAATLVRHRLFIPAMVVVIAIMGVFIWKLLPRGRMTAVPKTENSIAVISFENLTGDPRYDSLIKAIPSLFITKFEAMEFSYVATQERLQDILRQMGKDPDSPIDTETGFSICRREGIEALVVGKITKAGNVFATDIKVLEVDTKKSLTSATSQGEGEDSILLSQIDDLSSRITQKLGGGTLSTKAVPAVSEITTSSMEAYEFYLKGNEAIYKFYFDEACQHLLKAVEKDPSFARAYHDLAIAYSNLGNTAARKEAIQKAMEFSDKANPKEKLYIQARYAAHIERDNEKYGNILKEISERYPREKSAHYYLGGYYDSRNLFDEQILEVQKVLELDPNDVYALNSLASGYRRKGDFEKALEYAKRVVAAAPNEPTPSDTLGEIYFWAGRFDLAIEKFKEALAIKPDFFHSIRHITYSYALKEDYTEAIKCADEHSTRSSDPFNKATGYFLKAFFDYWTGLYDKALEEAEKARMVSEETQNLVILGNIYVLKELTYRQQGDFSSSRDSLMKYVDAMLSHFKDAPTDVVPAMKAVIEADFGSLEIQEGKIKEARKKLERLDQLLSESEILKKEEESTGLVKKYFLGELLMAEGSFDEAIAILEQVQFEEFQFSYLGI